MQFNLWSSHFLFEDMYFSHVGLVGDLINLALTHLITFLNFLS